MIRNGYPLTGVTGGNVQIVQSESLGTKETIRRLQKQITKILLINEAMWELLRDEHGYTDKKLAEKVREIDLRDGVEDNENQPRDATSCPSCGRNSPKRNRNCMYCGRELSNSLFTV